MAETRIDGARITALNCVVGSVVCTVEEDFSRLGGDANSLERIRKTIGLRERRIAAEGQTALDLGEAAARGLDCRGVDGLIFVTQTPDHFQPSNAAILHGRLGLQMTCAVFDVSQGCSGWVYGVYLAHQLVAAGGCRKVLLVTGDTLSRCIHPRDRASVILFGDAASACLIERSSAPSSAWFVLRHIGAESSAIQIPAGGFREPPSAANEEEMADADGNIRSRRNLAMDGGAVFNFTIRHVPGLIARTLEVAETGVENVDAFVLHQANRYLVSNVARRAKLPMDRVPMGTVERFGNVSGTSVPLTLATEVARSGSCDGRFLAAGFGVGLSLAGAILDFNRVPCNWSTAE